MSYLLIVPTKENLSDGFTKNVNRDTYQAHTPNYVRAREYWNKEYEEAKVDENEQSYGGDEVDWLLWRCEKYDDQRDSGSNICGLSLKPKGRVLEGFGYKSSLMNWKTQNIENGIAR